MKYYPISKWNAINDTVRLPFCYPTREAAATAAISAQNTYQDQKFTGTVKEYPDNTSINDIWRENP